MATRANTTSLAESQPLGVTAVAQAARGAPSAFRISIPSENGSTLFIVRKSTLSAFVEAAIDAMDGADGDCDLEDSDADEPDGTELDAAWIERTDQVADPLPSDRTGRWPNWRGGEDEEEDDPQGDTTEDEPAFDPLSRAIANLRGGGVAGCIISDDDIDPYY